MTWAKVDDRLYDDPRVEAAGVEAMGLFALALSYMGAYHTDGWITLARCRRLVGAQHGRRLALRLVEAGFWEAPADAQEAFRLVGWEALLVSAEEAAARSRRAAEVGRKGGLARAERARSDQGSDQGSGQGDHQGSDQGPPPTPEPCPGSFSSKSSEALESPQPTRAPDPDPIPTNPDSAQARACVDRPQPSSVVAPTLPGFEDAVSPAKVAHPPSSQAAPTPDEERVFAGFLKGRKWRGVVKGATPVLDAARLKIIRKRVAEKCRIEDLAAAAQGIWLDEWHVEHGQARFDLALRDADNIEKFATLHYEKIAEGRRDRGEPDGEPEDEIPAVPHVPLTPEQRADLAAELEYCKRFGAKLPEAANA